MQGDVQDGRRGNRQDARTSFAQPAREWVRTSGTFRIAEDDGHFVHVDDPDLVAAEIRKLVGRR